MISPLLILRNSKASKHNKNLISLENGKKLEVFADYFDPEIIN
jgi:hypothetical protein